MLQGLPRDQRNKVLEELKSRDPKMADLLAKLLINFEDLTKITPKMLVELLRKIRREDLGMALRLHQQETRQFFLENLAKNAREDILAILNGPSVKREKALESEERIMMVVREMASKGELNFTDEDTYV